MSDSPAATLQEDQELDALPSAITNLEADTLVASAPSANPEKQKPSLIGLSMDELKALMASVGLESYRAKQIWNWLYAKGAKDFSVMSNISKPAQAILAEHFTIARPNIVRHLTSTDGTEKWLLGFHDGNKIESVFIPETERGSLCVSSQVGCTLSCSFCHTGTMKLVRNLTAGEIVAQIMVCRDGLNEWGSQARSRFTNIVMMGMGEPLYNYDQVAKALKIIMDTDGIAISKKRITLSTSGVVPMIERVGNELGVNLAISLHAVRDDLRDELVPLNKKYPIAELMAACRNYPGASNARRITFEYVMLKGVNDSDADARALVKLLRDVHAKVNLIPFNPWHGSTYECSDEKRIQAFADIVHAGGYVTPIRRARGQDIYAACGMLKSDSERKKGQKVWLGDNNT
jgi:23S rRNA (adenine2503-C2)-methyltransferase